MTLVSLLEGTPEQLSGVALGSAVLLHAERALALLAIVIAALSVVLQAARGRLPVEFSTAGLRYGAEAADDAAAAVADLQDQFDDLESTTAALAERLDAVCRSPSSRTQASRATTGRLRFDPSGDVDTAVLDGGRLITRERRPLLSAIRARRAWRAVKSCPNGSLRES